MRPVFLKFLKLLIVAAPLFFVFSYFKLENKGNQLKAAKGMDEFIKTGIVYNPDVDNYLEEDYFSKNNLENGDFSQGLEHWATIRSENMFSIDQEEYVSFPGSLKLKVNVFPGRLYYSKSKSFTEFDYLPWGYQNSNIWLGVKPRQRIQASFYYKSAGPTVYLNLLEKSGNGRILASKIIREKSSVWKKVEISALVPEDGRAIGLEITLNNDQQGRIIFLDDIKMEAHDIR